MPPRRLWPLLLTLALFCLGCTDDVHVLSTWTRLAPAPAPAPVTLPGPFRPSATVDDARATLETVTPIPPDWRGKPLTLALPEYEGDVTLYVDGRPVPDHKLGFAHAWRIDDATASAPEVRLRLELVPAFLPSLDPAPRLSPTTDGDGAYRLVRGFSFYASSTVTAVLSFLCLLYLGLFALDRRHTAHGWFAMQAFVALTVASRVLLDTPRLLGGVHELQLDLLGGTLGLIGAAHFTSAHFRTRAPPRVLWGLVAIGLPLSLCHSIAAAVLVTRAAAVVSVVAFVWITSTLFRLRATVEDKVGATTLAVGWALFLVLACTDIAAINALGDIAVGWRGGVLGMGIFASLQVTLLLRDHVRTRRAADARAAALEEQSEEVRQLNAELRHQIADRSRQLAEALVRIGSVAPRSIELQQGDVVNARYRVVRVLGRGGMGAVYEVERLTDDRRFALKVLTGATTGVALARLAREAQIAAQVSHHCLVSIADVDVSETGALYIVMELVEGATLADLHARYGDAAWALPILRQIAAGLAALHAEGIVHRDLKPANVLLARPDDRKDPGVKIADFGIARLGWAALEEDAPIDPHAVTAAPADGVGLAGPLTETGALLGTPIYMAPELAFGARDAKPPSDLFAFGVIAHQLLTRALPFVMPPVLQKIGRRQWKVVLMLDEEECGAAVAALVARCLGEAPEGRPTAAECVEALRGA